ncbi:lysozyme inhibitor LprI family protein [Aliarcobacter lanthieri]|uniref:lysozyme inhibitor LprI family protein n=1 Tax=Aliarcobacter lanthieri TaxID=1355374 RepID=UPI003AFA4BBD
MKQISIILIFFVNLIYAQNIEFYKPSFDCENVKKYSVESLICKSNDLSKLDVELNEIYKKLLQIIPEKKELVQEQREFLKDRETCTNEDCIKNIYKDRLYILNSIYKFINVNLDDYKSQKIKYVDIDDFIYLYEIKSKLFVNKLLNILDIFEKNNYILFEDGFLIRFYDVRISNGIYYADTKTGKIKRVTGEIIEDNNWFIVKNSNPIKVVFKSGDGVHGVGYESIESITIKDGENIENKVIIETQYDMESGFCNRAEILGITKAGDIKNFEYDETKNLLKIDFIEQDCSNKKISNEKLVYDLKKDIFINKSLSHINFGLKTDCQINSFINKDKLFIGIGSIFNDETLKNKACLIQYHIDKKELIKEEIYSEIDSLYKIIPYNDKYFLLGAKLLPEDKNIGRSYADKGFTGLLLKLNKDFSIEKKVEINLDGFGNVRDFQIDNNKIVVLIAIKNSTIYDEELFATLFLNTFDTNLELLENLELKTNDCLANSFYIDKDKYIITDDYHKKICTFNKNGYMEKCLEKE